MQGHPNPEMVCSLCGKTLTLLPTDTCADENGKPVHPECYARQVTRKTPDPVEKKAIERAS
jgi:hypothetical protein